MTEIELATAPKQVRDLLTKIPNSNIEILLLFRSLDKGVQSIFGIKNLYEYKSKKCKILVINELKKIMNIS